MTTPRHVRPARTTAAGTFALGGALCAGAVGGLLRVHTVPLPSDPFDPAAWAAWAAQWGPTAAVLSVARWLALAGVVVASIGAALLVGHSVWAVRRGRSLHRWIAASVIASLVTALVTSSPSGAATDPGAPALEMPTDPPVVELVDAGPVVSRRADVDAGRHSGADPAPSSTAPLSTTTSTSRPGTPTRPTTAAPSSTTSTTGVPATLPRHATDQPQSTAAGAPVRSVDPADPVAASPGPAAAGRTAAPATPGAPSGSVTVRAGDSLWSIAERTVAARAGAPPSDAATAAYWTQLIEANRDRLVDPSDPGLILPGQVLVLP